MLKKFVLLFACLGLVAQLNGCTSQESKDSGEEMAVDAASADTAEVEKVEGSESLDITADDSASSLSSGDALPEDALGEAPAEDPMATVETPPTEEGIVADVPSETPSDLPADTLGEASLPSENVVESTPPVIEEPAPVTEAPTEVASNSSSSYESSSSDEPKKEAKPMPSYRKVEATPWKEGGKLLNTVYVSRAGDNWKSVSQMIYGSEKASELKKMNPAIKSRGLKPGDKVYFNSPHRPDDDTKVLTYYEDNGMAPEVYITKSGDNLKQVAKELFGSEASWKELYATNDFESKAGLDEGTQIRYWRSAPKPMDVATTPPPAPAPDMAMNEMPPPPPTNEMPPPPPTGDMAPPPPPPDMAMNEMAPPPPPPPVEAIAPPPPPPPVAAAPVKAGMDEAANPLDEDQTQMLAAGAIVFVGLALFIMLRRRRRRELEQAIQDTQVG
ncbi:MAG: hypothetical protein EOP04_10655 [Proteobacteria bacterium]|nr:MAG: hypothetical protein EOP04_10655 [Pseudomonadota bacterium]